MQRDIAIAFTAKSIERILKEGGTSSWRLDRNNARQCAYVVCTRNANADWVEGPETHHAAFLVGRVSDVVPCPDRQDRYLITFSEYALVDVPDVWQKGDRNPIRYATALQVPIDFGKLNWIKMPPIVEPELAGAHNGRAAQPLTMVEAKKGLALTFGVHPEAIEITIRG